MRLIFFGLKKKKQGVGKLNQRGIALLEVIPIMLIMFLLLGVTLGSWGVVHTAITYSISARHFNFYIFNNRSDLSYLRDCCTQDWGQDISRHFLLKAENGAPSGARFSLINSFPADDNNQYAPNRFANFNNRTSEYRSRDKFIEDRHGEVYSLVPEARNKQSKADPVWIMVGYGICLNAHCGGSN